MGKRPGPTNGRCRCGPITPWSFGFATRIPAARVQEKEGYSVRGGGKKVDHR